MTRRTPLRLLPLLALCACTAPPAPPPAPAPDTGPTARDRVPLLVATGEGVEGYRIGLDAPDEHPASEAPILNGATDTVPAPPPPMVRLHRVDHSNRSPWSPAGVPGTAGRGAEAAAGAGARAARSAHGDGRTLAAVTVPLGGERPFPDRYDPEGALTGTLDFLRCVGTEARPALWLDLPAEWRLSGVELDFLRTAVPATGGVVVVPEHVLASAESPGPGPSLASLRRDIGFDGAMAVHLGERPASAAARAAVAAILAGADLVLVEGDPAPVAREITAALDRGDLPLWRIDEAVGRVERLLPEPGEAGEADRATNGARRHEPAPTPPAAARRAVLVTAPPRATPIPLRRGGTVLLLHQRRDAALAAALSERLGEAGIRSHALAVDAGTLGPRTEGELARGLETADAILLLGGGPAVELAARATGDSSRPVPPALLLAFGPDDPPALGYPVLWSRQADEDGLDAVTGALRGEEPPVPGPTRFMARPAPMAVRTTAAATGMSEDRLREVDRLVEEALAEGHFTGAAVAVGRRGGLVRLRGYGGPGRWSPGAIDDRSPFDMASLTKVVATTSAVMLLVDDGRMTLDAPVRRWLPEFAGPMKDRVTVRHLLEHSSGLPAGGPLWRTAASPEHALREIMETPLRHVPGERTTYSDWGLVVLAKAVERAAGEPLDRLLARRLFGPLGMDDTDFLPPSRRHSLIAPTLPASAAPYERRGVVHDPNAFRLGGVAGHAGLFSTARDLAVFAQLMMNDGAYGSLRLIQPLTVQRFLRHRGPGGRRALGWEVARDGNSAGPALSPDAVGHTGYTGTSIWIDPEHEVFVILLTNRTYTGASSAPIMRLRRAVHEAAVDAIVDGR